ncbi:radial spoke head protein 3 homolog isoform X2 [Scylla paramamosain]|uniref:radial spoke head protein 3 homolog isoform X2 n=1 Tax=Scylla paramamosain TaxID=85552 RepID=UPI003082DC6F
MTEVMTMSAPAGVNLSTYTYTSAPRIVQNSRKGSNRGNGNPMYDRRVVRGSNYAKRLGNEPEPETNLRRQEFREKLEARARLRRESHGLSSLYPSHAAYARPRAHTHAYVQTENYYEPLERPPEAEVGLQTEAWGEDGFPPPVMFHSPAVADMSTQVFEDELYEEDEGDVAVAALVARTLREATLEVLEEEQEEEERLSRMREALLHKVASVGEDQEENSIDNDREGEEEGQEKEEAEEREDPDGKETSPLDTQEPARSPELPEDLVKGVTGLDDDAVDPVAWSPRVVEATRTNGSTARFSTTSEEEGSSTHPNPPNAFLCSFSFPNSGATFSQNSINSTITVYSFVSLGNKRKKNPVTLILFCF